MCHRLPKPPLKSKIPYDSAVSINGKHFDKQKWSHKHEAPTLLEIIQNPDHHDGREAEEIDERLESYVTYIEYSKWKAQE